MSQQELRQLVLGVLTERDAYGIEVAAWVADRLEPLTGSDGPAEGSIYPALRWLERHGLALPYWVEVGEAAPRRRYYSLTPKGRRVAARDRVRGTHPLPQPRPTASAARP
jgi:DNA-binding PadR family transcriptional regulator